SVLSRRVVALGNSLTSSISWRVDEVDRQFDPLVAHLRVVRLAFHSRDEPEFDNDIGARSDYIQRSVPEQRSTALSTFEVPGEHVVARPSILAIESNHPSIEIQEHTAHARHALTRERRLSRPNRSDDEIQY